MRPKGKLFALFAVFAAIGLVTASGAFTSVQADRTATVDVADDSNALVALQPADGDNGAYARQQGGQLQLVFNGSSGAGGSGINENATTEIDTVFNVTNQGTQPVDISVSVTDNGSDLNVGSGASQPYIYFYQAGDDTTDITQQGDGATINGVSTGSNASIGVYIDSHGLQDSDNFDLTVSINATAS